MCAYIIQEGKSVQQDDRRKVAPQDRLIGAVQMRFMAAKKAAAAEQAERCILYICVCIFEQPAPLSNTPQHYAAYYNTLQLTATHCSVLLHVLQHTAAHCITLQHIQCLGVGVTDTCA